LDVLDRKGGEGGRIMSRSPASMTLRGLAKITYTAAMN
jgi:hypothetical protein